MLDILDGYIIMHLCIYVYHTLIDLHPEEKKIMLKIVK